MLRHDAPSARFRPQGYARRLQCFGAETAESSSAIRYFGITLNILQSLPAPTTMRDIRPEPMHIATAYVMPNTVAKGLASNVSRHFQAEGLSRLSLSVLMGMFEIPCDRDAMMARIEANGPTNTHTLPLANAMAIAKFTYRPEETGEDSLPIDKNIGVTIDARKIKDVTFRLAGYKHRLEGLLDHDASQWVTISKKRGIIAIVATRLSPNRIAQLLEFDKGIQVVMPEDMNEAKAKVPTSPSLLRDQRNPTSAPRQDYPPNPIPRPRRSPASTNE
ncbi:hypothetical protein ColTof4_08432 [Colletotrichum tofieldiae]|nr:hypothetical protein ColTof3_02045 [Colletotrichum tofieldiae]GKT76009.1 hypothetical protein ColTof4_08432 [Colletotrichum tofieldiae]GKT83729.1 hypothetical protein Ct61P_01579 [Colletotrichum tofieldiae]